MTLLSQLGFWKMESILIPFLTESLLHFEEKLKEIVFLFGGKRFGIYDGHRLLAGLIFQY